MRRIWEFISSASQSRTTALLVILVIAAAIPLTVFVAQKQQSIQQKAANCEGQTIDTCTSAVGCKWTSLNVDDPDYFGPQGICSTDPWCTLNCDSSQTCDADAHTCESPSVTLTEKQICDNLCDYRPGAFSSCPAECQKYNPNNSSDGTGGIASDLAPGVFGFKGCVTLGICASNGGQVQIATGGGFDISWDEIQGAASCTLAGVPVNPSGSGTIHATVNSTTTYTLSCTSPGGKTNALSVTAVAVPVVGGTTTPPSTSTGVPSCTITANPTTVNLNGTVTLTLATQNTSQLGSCRVVDQNGKIQDPTSLNPFGSSVTMTSLPIAYNSTFYLQCPIGTNLCSTTTVTVNSTGTGTGPYFCQPPGFTGSNGCVSVSQPCSSFSGFTACTPGTITPTVPTTPTGNATFSLGLDGIGSTGDRANPNASSLSNKNPKHPINIGVYPVSATVLSASAKLQEIRLTYDSSTGKYTGRATLPSISAFKIDMFGHLAKIVTPSSDGLFSADFVGGDINNDNQLSVLDHNMLVSCIGSPEPVPSTGKFSTCSSDADINMDGIIDQIDYNLWLREFKTGPRDGD